MFSVLVFVRNINCQQNTVTNNLAKIVVLAFLETAVSLPRTQLGIPKHLDEGSVMDGTSEMHQ